jgi:hypothetical protein
MRTETIQVNYYKFNELSDEAKQFVLEKLWSLNVEHEWWEDIYEDAREIGLRITGFNIGRGNGITGDLTLYPKECAEAILKNHGEGCDTYILAKQFLEDLKGLGDEESEDYDSDAKEDLEQEFERALKEEYLSILRNEYEYLTSEEAIVESIEINKYEFNEEGELQ